MADILTIDNSLVENKRQELNLPKPTDFEGGRLDPELVEKLMPLVLLPFDEDSIDKGKNGGFSSKGINYNLQLNRLQQVFGTTHVKVEHRVVESKIVEKEDKQDMYYYKTYVVVKIGNYTLYTSASHIPDTNFVPYYITEGIGWAGAVNEGTAEKNSRANGLKEALKNMGMLRYLYLNDDNEDDESSSGNYKGIEGTVVLTTDATFYDTGVLFMKSRAKDVDKDKEVELIIYRNNSFNEKQHNEMVDMLSSNKSLLKTGKSLNIEYQEKEYNKKLQYIIMNVKTKS